MADSRDNRGPELAAVTCFFLGVSWLFVLLRCFVRAKITNSFQMDDWLMVCSVVSFGRNARTHYCCRTNMVALVYFHCLCCFLSRSNSLWVWKAQHFFDPGSTNPGYKGKLSIGLVKFDIIGELTFPSTPI